MRTIKITATDHEGVLLDSVEFMVEENVDRIALCELATDDQPPNNVTDLNIGRHQCDTD